MQKKSETFSNFCEFKALVEKELGKQVVVNTSRVNSKNSVAKKEFEENS